MGESNCNKDKQVSDIIRLVRNVDKSRRADQALHHEDHLRGPLFSFLIGSGFSLSCGLPATAHLVSALREYSSNREQKWDEIFENTKDKGGTESVCELTDQYFDLMENVLDSPVGRQSFVTAAVKWSSRRKEYAPISTESKLLAAILINGTQGSFSLIKRDISGVQDEAGNLRNGNADQDNKEEPWLSRSFAAHIFTTNFDEVMPTTFYIGNQPIDIIDYPSKRTVSQAAIYPTIVYLHGRHLHYNLRNTRNELSTSSDEDPRFPDLFTQFREMLRVTGLIVIGYSGSEGRIMEVIKEALHDPDSLKYDLWWLTYKDRKDLHPDARYLLENNHRAHYLEVGKSAKEFLLMLCEELGIENAAIDGIWLEHIKVLGKKLDIRDSFADVREYKNKLKSAVRDGSKLEISEPLIGDWTKWYERQVRVLINGNDENKMEAAEILRWIGMLYLHGGSMKVGKGEDGKEYKERGKNAINQAIEMHQELGNKNEEAADWLHLGAYQTKIPGFENLKPDNERMQSLHDEAKESLLKSNALFKIVGNPNVPQHVNPWIEKLKKYYPKQYGKE